MSPGGSASDDSASRGATASGSRRRAQRRSSAAFEAVEASYARSTSREESHGGEKANAAARTATMPAGIATRPDIACDRSSDTAIPAKTNAGSPTAGIVHTQSPPVWTVKYAAAPRAPAAASQRRV